MSLNNDFGTMDSTNYNDAMNAFTSSLNSATATAASAKSEAERKVDKFNEAIQAPFQTLGIPLIEQGTQKLFERVRSGISQKFGQKAGQLTDEARSRAGKVFKEVGDIKESALTEAGTKIPANPLAAIQETNLDEALASRGTAAAAQSAGVISDAPDTENFDRIFGQAIQEDEFKPNLIPTGARGRVTLSAPTDAGEQVNKAASGLAEKATEGATDGAATAVEKTAKAGKDLEDGLKTASSVADDAAAGEAGTDPIADAAAVGLGLAMVFTGMFAKKHIPQVAPPPLVNPSVQFGV
jgi:hypothetical protein